LISVDSCASLGGHVNFYQLPPKWAALAQLSLALEDIDMANIKELQVLVPLLKQFNLGNDEDLSKPEVTEHLLGDFVGVNQTQIAALLGLSPQAVSKGLRDDGILFLSKDRRVFRLHQALMAVGGDKYLTAALKLRELSRPMEWGSIPTNTTEVFSPQDVYATSDELWVFADNPADTLDWEILREQIFTAEAKDPENQEKLLVFFVRTLEAAERWAGILERELIAPSIEDDRINLEKKGFARHFVYIVVSNTFPYAQDFILSNPGSRCMGIVGAAKTPTIYVWTGASYVRPLNQNFGVIDLAQQLDLGTAALKMHFFPKGFILRPEVASFQNKFLDGMIAIRGGLLHEDEHFYLNGELADEEQWIDPLGLKMAGGVLSNPSQQPLNTQTFNKKSKFCPLFICVYRRKPGESFNERRMNVGIHKVVSDELQRRRDERSEPSGFEPSRTGKFW
jgi:hypothetical protein